MNFFRELVSGQKVRFQNGSYNLDLTYITNRVIAMSFPASGFESSYRNNIDDVAKFLWEHHGDQYMLFNLSNRKYDYEKFGDRIREFPWEDHHSPPIDMLFDVCKQVDDFLNSDINNAGKGRTGTLICCYLLYSGRCQSTEEARYYYSKKRFNKAKSGVTQPSQVRYITYFHSIFKNPEYSSQLKILDSITFVGKSPKMTSNKSCKPSIDIYTVRNKMKQEQIRKIIRIYSGLKEKEIQQEEYLPKILEHNIKIGNSDLVVSGDILIKCYHIGKIQKLVIHFKGTLTNKFMFRFAFNTCIIDSTNELIFDLANLDPDSNVRDKKFSPEFLVKVNFKNVCLKCINLQFFHEKCQICQTMMKEEKESWERVYQIMNSYHKYELSESRILLFGDPDYDDFEEVLEKQRSAKIQLEESAEESEEEGSENEEEEKKQF